MRSSAVFVAKPQLTVGVPLGLIEASPWPNVGLVGPAGGEGSDG